MTARSDVLFITDKTKLLKSALGQKAKYSLGADVFRFGPNTGHRSIGSACPFGAMSCHSSHLACGPVGRYSQPAEVRV
jgi:hypothetical protein